MALLACCVPGCELNVHALHAPALAPSGSDFAT